MFFPFKTPHNDRPTTRNPEQPETRRRRDVNHRGGWGTDGGEGEVTTGLLAKWIPMGKSGQIIIIH